MSEILVHIKFKGGSHNPSGITFNKDGTYWFCYKDTTQKYKSYWRVNDGEFQFCHYENSGDDMWVPWKDAISDHNVDNKLVINSFNDAHLKWVFEEQVLVG